MAADQTSRNKKSFNDSKEDRNDNKSPAGMPYHPDPALHKAYLGHDEGKANNDKSRNDNQSQPMGEFTDWSKKMN